MASNHTEHFSLNQWQADDQVKRTDFNEDNAKNRCGAERSLGRAGEKRPPRRRWRPSVKKLASMPCLVTGTYTGDGTDSRLISLGFQPKALLVMREEGYSARPYTDDYYGGLALPGKPVCLQTSYGTNYIFDHRIQGLPGLL